MEKPTITDCAQLIITLFDKFVQTNPVVLKYQNLCTYKYREMILFFMMMQFRRIYQFKTQYDWLVAHPSNSMYISSETGLTLLRAWRDIHIIQPIPDNVNPQNRGINPSCCRYIRMP
jgi:hypothetical protein